MGPVSASPAAERSASPRETDYRGRRVRRVEPGLEEGAPPGTSGSEPSPAHRGAVHTRLADFFSIS